MILMGGVMLQFFRPRHFLFKRSWIFVLLITFLTGLQAYGLEGEHYSIIEKDHKKGLVNQKGEVLIPTEYDDLGWSEGMPHAIDDMIGYKKNGLWGLLNTKNEKLIEPVYTYLLPFDDNNLIGAKKLPYNNEIVYGLINLKGKTEIDFKYFNLSKSNDRLIVMVREQNRYRTGLMDAKEKVYIPINYQQIKPLGGDLYAVLNNHEQRAIFNKNGHDLTGFILDSIATLKKDFALIYKDGKEGLIDKSAATAILPQYKNIKMNEDGTFSAQKFTRWLLLDEHNNTIDTFYYDAILPAALNTYKVSIGSAEALINEQDSNLTGFKNFRIGMIHDDLAIFEKDRKYGVIHKNGDILLPAIYDSLTIQEDFLLVKEVLNGQHGWSLLDRNGKRITTQLYDAIFWLGDRYFKVKQNKYWGIINSSGKAITICKYDHIDTYIDGHFKVNLLGEDGILDTKGEWEVAPQKKDIDIVDPIRYLVRSPYGSYVAYYPDIKQFDAEYFLYKKGGQFIEKTLDKKIGLVDDDGNRIIKPEYDEISDLLEDSIYIARNDNKYTFITKNGRILNRDDQRFQEVVGMREYFIGVKIDGKWGFVDVNGKLRIANRYNGIGLYHEGLAPIKILGHWGYIDKLEVLKVQPRYDEVSEFKNGLCIVIRNGKYGLINAEGHEVIEPQYDSLYRLENGGFISVRDNEKGLINKAGKNLIFPRFAYIKDLSNGFVIVERKGHYGLMSTDGLSPIPMLYDNLIYDPYRKLYLAASPGKWETINLKAKGN